MIFCVEDDNGIRNMMIYTLRASGFEAEGFADGKSFTDALATTCPELVLLDIMLPGEDGISILTRLRQTPATAHIPVILASAKGTEYDKVTGFDLGADGYLAKPFGMMEMVSNVRAVLRRISPPKEKSLLCVGTLEMDPDSHTVTAKGARIQLTLKEYDMLRLFMENPGRVFSRDKLLELVWGDDFFGETRTVDVHVGTLRDKLGACGRYIVTVRGVGYRMEIPAE